MKRIKMSGLNVLLLFAHNAPSEQHTPTRGVIWYVQSYLVLHLHAKKRLATNKQKTRAQSRSSRHGNNHCPDLLKIKTIKFCGKIRKTPKGADQLYSRSKETRQTQNPWQISGF